MKSILTIAAAAVALLADADAANAQQAPASYKATRDFSYMNPSGVWSYGVGVTGDKATFKRMVPLLDKCGAATEGSDCFREGNALVADNQLGVVRVEHHPSSSLVIPADALQLHTGGQDTIVQFKAPGLGSYKIEGYYQTLDNRPSGVTPKIFVNSKDLTRKAFGVTADIVMTGPADIANKVGGEKRGFSLTRELKKGDVVQFGLNPAGDSSFDTTAFDVVITPTFQ